MPLPKIYTAEGLILLFLNIVKFDCYESGYTDVKFWEDILWEINIFVNIILRFIVQKTHAYLKAVGLQFTRPIYVGLKIAACGLHLKCITFPTVLSVLNEIIFTCDKRTSHNSNLFGFYQKGQVGHCTYMTVVKHIM